MVTTCCRARQRNVGRGVMYWHAPTCRNATLGAKPYHRWYHWLLYSWWHQ